VLIAIAVVVIIYFKLKVWKLITAKKNEAEPEDDY